MDYLLKGDGVGIPHIFIFGNGNGAYVAADLVNTLHPTFFVPTYPIDGVVLSHTNDVIEDDQLRKYVSF